MKQVAMELAVLSKGLAWALVKDSPMYTSYPSLANAKAGEFFAKYFIDLATEASLNYFREGTLPPEPIMKWIVLASAGGMLFPA